MSYESYFGYVEKLSGNGWLKIKLDDGLEWPVPEFLKVYVNKSGEREEFKILEGRLKGKRASVKKKGWTWSDWDGSYFEGDIKPGDPYKGSADMIFYRNSEILKVSGLGEFEAITDPSNPSPVGKHDVEIPYEPHPGGGAYTTQAKYAKTWFRLGHHGDRFLHCGRVSAGCVTVTDVNKWDEIYKHIIVSRKGFDSVGTIEIIDQ